MSRLLPPHHVKQVDKRKEWDVRVRANRSRIGRVVAMLLLFALSGTSCLFTSFANGAELERSFWMLIYLGSTLGSSVCITIVTTKFVAWVNLRRTPSKPSGKLAEKTSSISSPPSPTSLESPLPRPLILLSPAPLQREQRTVLPLGRQRPLRMKKLITSAKQRNRDLYN